MAPHTTFLLTVASSGFHTYARCGFVTLLFILGAGIITGFSPPTTPPPVYTLFDHQLSIETQRRHHSQQTKGKENGGPVPPLSGGGGSRCRQR